MGTLSDILGSFRRSAGPGGAGGLLLALLLGGSGLAAAPGTPVPGPALALLGGPFSPLEINLAEAAAGAAACLLLVLIALRSVAQRRRAEAALRTSEQITRTISNNFSHGMIYQAHVDRDGNRRFTYLSDSVKELYGVSPREAMADASLIYGKIHRDDFATLTSIENQAIANLSIFKAEARVVGPRGEIRWSSFVSTPRAMPDGSIFWDGIEFIITERKLAEEELREAYQFSERILSSALEGIIVYGLDLRYRVWNPYMEALTGIPARDVLGKHPLEVFPFLEETGLMERLRAVLAGAGPSALDFPFANPGTGKQGWVTDTIALLPDSKGDPVGVIAMVRDITERTRAEAERTRLMAQLQQTQKMESLGSLAGGIAHDMNNVLGAILALASANLELQPAGSPGRRAFETIASAAVRGGKMVKGLLDFARQNPAEERELDLNGILRDEVHLLERTTLAKVRLELDLSPGLRAIRGDPGALTNAIMNLCVNAVDAMPDHGNLLLRTRNLEDGRIEVLVRDTGRGMSQEVLARAMDPFFTTKDTGKGTGLGLALVYSTIKAHHGQMEIESEAGRGTRVWLRFPAAPAPGPPGEPAAGGPAGSPRRGLSVLLVDDDELVRSGTRGLLEVLGHAVRTTTCGEEGLAELAGGWRPDAVILDLNMPGLGGAGTLPRLRALLPAVPVLLATGRVDQATLDLVKAHPGVALLAKPYSMAELRAQLDRIGPEPARG